MLNEDNTVSAYVKQLMSDCVRFKTGRSIWPVVIWEVDGFKKRQRRKIVLVRQTNLAILLVFIYQEK